MSRIVRLGVLLVTAAAVLYPIALEGQQRSSAQGPSSGLELTSIDRSVDACVDFYQFACGGWRNQHPVPPDLAGIGRAREMRERMFAVMTRILTTATADPERRKAGDYYAACMDEAAIEARGIAPLQTALSRIAELNTRDRLPGLVAYLHRIAWVPEVTLRQPAYSALFDLRSERYQGKRIPSIRQGGLSLPARDLYLSSNARAVAVRDKFQSHVQQMLALLGVSPSDAAIGARAVLAIETRLAAGSTDALGQRALDQRSMELAALQKLAPHFDWNAYLTALSVPPSTMIAVMGDPTFMKAFDSVVAEAPLADLQHYLRWQLAHASTLLLPAAFRNAEFELFKKTLRGQQKIESRSELCITETDDRLGDVLSKAFVEETFSPRAKSDVLQMVGEIKAAMSAAIADASWMSDETKKAADAKLQTLITRIGYPERWKDYSTLHIANDNALVNFQRALAFARDQDLAQIGRAFDPTEWPSVTASRLEALNRPQLNDMLFPAGLLQPPMYRANGDRARNYGAIGAVIGHEVTHGFDDLGRRVDARGNWSNWWTDPDAARFQQRASCFVDQYSQYEAAGGSHVDGRLTLGENIADNGGLRLALMAYLAGAGATAEILDGFTGEQRLFISWAQVWCVNVRPEAERLQIDIDPHSPNRYRVNGPLSNMPEFQKAFSCKANAPMVRTNACRLW